MSPFLSRILATFGGLLLVALLVVVSSGSLPVVSGIYQRLELLIYDQRMRLHLPDEAKAAVPIVIIDIDEASLQHEGRWPWSRAKIADLVGRLNESGAAVIGFDILFGEAERNPAEEVLAGLNQQSGLYQQLSQLQINYDRDQIFANQLAESEVVLGYLFHYQYDLTSGLLPEPLQLNNQPENLVSQLVIPKMTGYAAPLAELTKTARGGGFFSLAPDADGVVRRAPMLARYDNQLYASLSLEMLRQFMFLEAIQLKTSTIAGKQHLEKIYLDQHLALPTDSSGQLLIPFRGPAETFPYIPAWQLLAGEADTELLQGALVLVGTSAPGLFDLRATPVASVYPGVEVHANLLAAMLDKQFLQQPSWAPGANLVIALLAGLTLALSLPWLAPLLQVLISFGVSVAIISITSWLWVAEGIVLALAGPLLLVFLLTVFNFVWGFFYESMTRHRLADMFGQYVPPQLVEEMSRHPGNFSFAGESRELSVLFSDIRGFTTLSESLAADELKVLLNRYFTPITGVIFDHRGTIDKYIGDLVMAFWGAPVNDPDHALHSIQAAMQMLKATDEISDTFVSEGLPAISVGIGINSGLMNVGDMGSKYRRAYTVLGDAVNLASRLESSTKYYGVSLLVGERTRELALDYFLWRELDLVKVKGKDYPVKVYQPLCLKDEATSELNEELQALDKALLAFRTQDFVQSKKIFSQLQEDNPNIYQYTLYLERIQILEKEPPAKDWDGSWTRADK
ncbi:MAG TPA: adenylate/guanylate cyclase domain-containing protein [Marinospirillum sp.]|uniref:CHASE2 domain-containing protein n=1 Tax=Marinospirillum sp. TaxID=2183934 RepID=UPI002B4A92A9|nr:adenylate/guanylate cyclase domain-containing protein [Marinospirillum sp.]HKM15401.1 adenylate/guanylate cyclase domain-containing protein [Marinospirillum sp.]